jgi:hypothetical protein
MREDDDVVRVFIIFFQVVTCVLRAFWLGKGNDNFGVLEGCGLRLLGCCQKNPPGLRTCIE